MIRKNKESGKSNYEFMLDSTINNKIDEASEKRKKRTEEQIAKAEADLADVKASKSAVVQRFKEQKRALRGIYEGVSGDPDAF